MPDLNMLTMVLATVVMLVTQLLKMNPKVGLVAQGATRAVQATVILLSMLMGVLDAMANDPGKLATMPWGDMAKTVLEQGAVIAMAATLMYQTLKGFLEPKPAE